MIDKIVIASHNQGKITEIRALLAQFQQLQIASATDYNCDDVEETGTTFTANALIKARHVFAQTQLPSLADDSGLCINALAGKPGVYSARYAKQHGGFVNATHALNRELSSYDDKSCYFLCVLAYVDIGGEYVFEGKVTGTFSELKGKNGFGYDGAFIPHGYDKTFAELSAREKGKVSHRAIAFNQFVEFISAHRV
jgi:XTP/dITP diphosphohydrolase